MPATGTPRDRIRDDRLADAAAVLARLAREAPVGQDLRDRAHARAIDLVRDIRERSRPGLMEVFLAEYGLSTEEGVALMCLAEALLRVPDADTIDALIEDKIAPSEWSAHLGHSSSPLVNASTWGLMLTGRILREGDGPASVLRAAIRRLGEPVIRTAVGRAIREMGHQFVLGRTIDEALERGRSSGGKGYTFSYDMLGEAALTAKDAQGFMDAYSEAIARLATTCESKDIRDNPGISIKLSALHPRYETGQHDRVMTELVPRVLELARAASAAGMGLNIDAEEADRLELSLDVIEAVLTDDSLTGWGGFGVVVQAYGKRAGAVLDWLHALAARLDRRIMVRLVKGAYWDTEIKRAQVEGLAGFPVYTHKAETDVSYLHCAQKLLGMTDRIYPQFATHNAHSVAAILAMGADSASYEFQRLHGMGEALHDRVLAAEGTRCRIYAPVGAHRDLLAYLVRRLLENGANSSFVNQIVDETVPPEAVAADPFDVLARVEGHAGPVTAPADLFRPERANARGWELREPDALDDIDAARSPWADHRWQAGPVLAAEVTGGEAHEVRNPARPDDVVGQVVQANEADLGAALAAAAPWTESAAQRAAVLNRAADLYEANFGEIFALLAREAGKGLPDAVAELREAVDFLRYYAARGEELADAAPWGVFTCISPWNFPLAIFTGQISAALAAGNAVLAKPAEATGLIAHRAVELLHQAGVPRHALQLVPGAGRKVGVALTGDARVGGVCFTGSTATAQAIHRAMAPVLRPDAPLIAETGGLNAMIVDSTALPEQAVKDIVISAFQSAGQRCSALRVLYVQKDIADSFTEMLLGAMDELRLGDPWRISTDIGPVIDADAKAKIDAHVAAAKAEGRLVHQVAAPRTGTFVGPAVIRVSGIGDLAEEIFGPVLHLATYRAEDLDRVVDAINASGFGLTFGMHSRIDDRVDQVTRRLKVGNLYINRNQIGAIVGSQPFGGEGLSGTGPKAGGPNYVPRFTRRPLPGHAVPEGPAADPAQVAEALRTVDRPDGQVLHARSLPGPTGESNRLTEVGRGVILCLGPTLADAREQARIAGENGCRAVVAVPGCVPPGVDGTLPRDALRTLAGFDGVALWSAEDDLRAARVALAARDGALIPLLTGPDMGPRCRLERHLCIDTTAAGGNATLLAQAGREVPQTIDA
ncbi:bifunctional proline dehydrogenase/L-glutamate gamma-semialdehyde dehydrogenase PutA [Rhodobacteraceae bacterium 2CG4]|uniref:Bifunctional protein PutA n=1 Tax=Halovulum marinum TaxID=2662447 RepID=A0A6L5YWP6_9RHOB|nr:bifunctional proline dehydrogenase/L-glutamate gamma-semialdehyde dehydrogenase PutA [Halovulum marinum]MSU88741.1 bifunctional proline dehydrogenase/L-glutamate gamma-semialdehyde dehydrogenase PutA [Halovulum marinum]